jgi:PleD family two-component response regulator
VLFPETDLAPARELVSRLQQTVSALVRERGRTITVSIGLAAFHSAPPSAEAAIRIADDLMYAAKREEKGGVRERAVA